MSEADDANRSSKGEIKSPPKTVQSPSGKMLGDEAVRVGMLPLSTMVSFKSSAGTFDKRLFILLNLHTSISRK